jgi:signal transduction histidine kinase
MLHGPVVSNVRAMVRADTVVALGLGVLVIVGEATSQSPGAWSLAAGLVAVATVAFRRSRPELAALVVILVASAADAQVVPIAVVLDYYLLGSRSADRGWRWSHALLVLLPVAGIATDPSTPSPGNPLVVDVLSVWGFFIVLPFVAGRVTRSRSMMTEALRLSARQLKEEQESRARQLVSEERMRIARELHDVVAHSVSVMVIQTGAARRIAAHDPDRAVQALLAVETCGREALVDLRRMVGVLHREDLEVLGGAAPGLAQLDKLVERARGSGMPVELLVDGEARPLPAALDLMSFRVVQEALTNAIKHAGQAQARVHVTFSADFLELEVADTGRQGATPPANADLPGHGLVGMQERLTLYGGTLRTGPARGGGFRVLARIPLDQLAPA